MRTLGLILALFAFVILISNIAAIVQRNNGIPNPLEAMFPEMFVDEEEIQALETQTAPFADARPLEAIGDAGIGVEYTPLGTERVSVDMNLPHLHEGAINKWVMQAVAEALTFAPTDDAAYAAHQEILKEFMSVNGINEYNKFLRRIKAVELMRSNNYELKTFIDGIPQLRTSGVVGNVYRWVYDVPLIMTFLPVGAQDYREMTSNQGDQFLTEKVFIRVQLGRVAEGGREGIVIETWDVLKKK